MIMTLEKVKLIDSNPTINGRIYPQTVIEKMYRKISASQPHERFGEFGMPTGHTVDLEDVAFVYSNPALEDGVLYVDVQILETPKGKALMDVIEHVDFKPVGFGNVDENNVLQDDYELISINAI